MSCKTLSLFSGVGAFEKAMDNIELQNEVVRYSEKNEYASKSYCAIHNITPDKNLGDITKVKASDLPEEVDLITYGFPCQDISAAGQMQGMFNEDGTLTRSGLFFDALRIIKQVRPKVAIAENVKNLTRKKFAQQFDIVLNSLSEAGYNNYWHVLNAKDFGLPQFRERVFIISIRKDIDDGSFKFPEGRPLELKLEDFIENDVDEKFYYPDNKIPEWTGKLPDSVGQEIVQLGNLMPGKNRANPNQGRLYDKRGLCPTLSAMEGGSRQPFIIVEAGNE